MAKRGGKGPKIKGNKLEWDVVRLARDQGLRAGRSILSLGVDVRINDKKISCKRRKKFTGMLKEFVAELDGHDAVFCREDRGKIVVIKYLGWDQ